MRTTRILALTVVATVSVCAEPRTVTLTTKFGLTGKTLEIPAQTVAELVTGARAWDGVEIVKDGLVLEPDLDRPPPVVAGPAEIRLLAPLGLGPARWVTVRLTPETYAVDKALLVAPTTNQVTVSMECSTNLVDWISITNVVFTNVPAAKFFRLGVVAEAPR
jgi:hypothetical protein